MNAAVPLGSVLSEPRASASSCIAHGIDDGGCLGLGPSRLFALEPPSSELLVLRRPAREDDDDVPSDAETGGPADAFPPRSPGRPRPFAAVCGPSLEDTNDGSRPPREPGFAPSRCDAAADFRAVHAASAAQAPWQRSLVVAPCAREEEEEEEAGTAAGAVKHVAVAGAVPVGFASSDAPLAFFFFLFSAAERHGVLRRPCPSVSGAAPAPASGPLAPSVSELLPVLLSFDIAKSKEELRLGSQQQQGSTHGATIQYRCTSPYTLHVLLAKVICFGPIPARRRLVDRDPWIEGSRLWQIVWQLALHSFIND